MPLWVICCTNSTFYVWRGCNPGCWLCTYARVHLPGALTAWVCFLAVYTPQTESSGNLLLWTQPPQGLFWCHILSLKLPLADLVPCVCHFHCLSNEGHFRIADLVLCISFRSWSGPLQETLLVLALCGHFASCLCRLRDTSLATLWGTSTPSIGFECPWELVNSCVSTETCWQWLHPTGLLTFTYAMEWHNLFKKFWVDLDFLFVERNMLQFIRSTLLKWGAFKLEWH